MTINLRVPKADNELKPRITVVGVGGAGGNAVNNMVRSSLGGVEFVAANTDAQALQTNLAERKIQLGLSINRGLGAGAKPEVGRAAAEESIDEIMSHLQGSNMVFITAGQGGGTGTGAAPVIARASRELGILTVGVVTKPFTFEGAHRMKLAESGIEELQQYVDTLIVIPNQNLFRIANERTTFADAFKMADDVLYSGVRGVTDLITMPGLINLDFADIQTVMAEMGKAMMGTGEAEGDRRAIDAAEAAINNPLLDDVSMKGARAVLINITGGLDMTLFEVDEAANRIRSEVDPDANIIFGAFFDEKLTNRMRISVVAAGMDAAAIRAPLPQTQNSSMMNLRPKIVPHADVIANARKSAPQSVPPQQTSYTAMRPPQMAAVERNVSMNTPETPKLDKFAMPSMEDPTAPFVAPQPMEVKKTVDELVVTERFTAQSQTSSNTASEAPKTVSIDLKSESVTETPSLSVTATERMVVESRERAPESRDAEKTRRGPGLFERMMGGTSKKADPVVMTPSSAVANTPAPETKPAANMSEPSDLAAPKKGEQEDLLDIPAFLRRQAN